VSAVIVLPWPAFTVTEPVIGSILRSQAPVLPEGFVYGTVGGPDSTEPATRTPVLRLAGCTYWAVNLADDSEAMGIVAYTATGEQRQRWIRHGARSLWEITVDPVMRTVTFHGRRRQATGEPGTITMTWDELLPLQPIVSRRPRTHLPAVPPDLVCPVPGEDGPDRASCPVLRFGEYTYWAFNFRDARLALAIVAYDGAGRQVRRWDRDGAREARQITSDPVGRTVTFHGQPLLATRQPGTIRLSWDELWIG
jgi:hypothetical protein